MIWAFYLRSVRFTKGVISGQESLGGSESACIGLARALVKRGHDVIMFAHDLASDAKGADHGGVVWTDATDIQGPYWHWQFDVFVSLRMPEIYTIPIDARWRVLWNQDLLIDFPKGTAGNLVASTWQLDTLAYVSEFHRKQWEGVQGELTSLGWVTTNGFDPTYVPDPATVTKDWKRVIHISRPERGLGPLLAMWPRLRERVPDAELHLCRYSSMYDAGGWGQVCASYDDMVRAVNERVGGITYLGELGKPALYRAIAEAAVMWYPGIATFAETSCIAAIEAQACGTPFVGSFRGALPETVPSGKLVRGDAETDDAYAAASLTNVETILRDCQRQAVAYRQLQEAGRAHVFPAYTFDAIAAEWEAKAASVFDARTSTQLPGIVRQLLQHDDHVAARKVLETSDPLLGDSSAADLARCDLVIAGADQGPDDFAAGANVDAIREGDTEPRYALAAHHFAGVAQVVDVACGNGAFALRLARQYPTIRVTGLDYSQQLVDRANATAREHGLADRVTFERVTVYDYATHQLTDEAQAWFGARHGQFDGLFCGEFVEHVAGLGAFIDGLEASLADDARVVLTMPHGPWGEMRPWHQPIHRAHVHHFQIDDLRNVFGAKEGLGIQALDYGWSSAGSRIGGWVVSYRTSLAAPTGDRDLAHRVWSSRPRPKLSVGILAHDGSVDLRRCLESIYAIADEIVIGDSSATTTHVAETAKDYGATVLPIASPLDLAHTPDGFAGARNRVLDACTGDWFLWIDTDEVLVNPVNLRKYLDGGPFNGYALKQNHLQVDLPYQPNHPRCHDEPVRLFRRRPDIRFYGCVHEQPQMGGCNDNIIPCLKLHDVEIEHRGYSTLAVRKAKSDRNLPLMLANRIRFPERRLNYALEVRECVLRGEDAVEQGLTQDASRLFTRAIQMFEEQFPDPSDKTGELVRIWYENALKHLNGSWEFDIALSGIAGSLNGKQAQLKRKRVRRYEDLEKLVLLELQAAKEGMAGCPVPQTEPWVPAHDEVTA